MSCLNLIFFSAANNAYLVFFFFFGLVYFIFYFFQLAVGLILFYFFSFIYLFFYFTVLYWFCHILTWICHGCTCVPHPEPPFHLPPHPIPLDHPGAPAPSTLSHASNLDWWFVSHMIIYMFQCHSPISSHPCPLPQSPKDCSIHLFLFCCLTYRITVAIFLNSIKCVSILYWCLSFWLTSLCIMGSSFVHLVRTDSDVLFSIWVIFHGVYAPQLSYPFVCWWASRLLPCPGCYFNRVDFVGHGDHRKEQKVLIQADQVPVQALTPRATVCLNFLYWNNCRKLQK